ncbi:DNA mismatch repair [Colletotrichum asianum]|uniref:DNA mismatch repair n=1 Tax=Colletotrichum asianum TaxID=702518 RepID=A0A8H3W190_9PEZI|nr:DNA mismatch repair [Colletotrichum asianum]
MPITRLPLTTVRRLGSSVVIVTPVSLVKELVDNSIDAGATSIEIIVSANAVDKIQVRDNGHGIDSEDFDALGRRSHTSKLRTFEELQSKGGQTLGFRGDALASTNTMSKLTITTRTAEDPAANLLTLNPNGGGILAQKPVASPVGTTVDASDIFAGFPVRRQQAIKDSKKAHSQIKELLFTYALTRPRIRLSLKIQSNHKLSWSYAPTVGADKTYSGNTSEGGATRSRPNTPASILRLEAFMPKPGAKPAAIAGKGYFISVDGRPMATAKGTMKKLVGIYKQHLRKHVGAPSENLKTPFIRLDIECILGSYDPNVATNKDEVLFANEPKLLELFEDMCQDLYQNCDGQADMPEQNVVVESSSSGQGGHLYNLEDTSAEKASDITNRQLAIPPSDRTSAVGSSAAFVNKAGGYHDHPDRSALKYTTHLADDTLSLANEKASQTNSSEAQISRQESLEFSSDSGLTQSFLRSSWDVDMARSNTASPVEYTQEIFLNPLLSDISEHLGTQRMEQSQREKPNPWSLAKKAAKKSGGIHSGHSENSADIEQSEDNTTAPVLEESTHIPNVENVVHESESMTKLVPEDRENALGQLSQCHQALAMQREHAHQTDDFESSGLRTFDAPHGFPQDPSYMGVPRILGDEEQYQRSGLRHEFDDLPDDIARDLGLHRRRAQTPHPSTIRGQDNFFGTPPSSSSPLHKPFRVPVRAEVGRQERSSARSNRPRGAQGRPSVGERKRNGLSQSKLAFNATKNLKSSQPGDFQHAAAGYSSHGDFDDNYDAVPEITRNLRHNSPTPTERDIAGAIERLNALRPRPHSIIHKDLDRSVSPSPTERDISSAVSRMKVFRHQKDAFEPIEDTTSEERERPLTRGSTTTTLEMSPRGYLRKRLASRSRSRNKTHKRMKSELLPFERPSEELYLQLKSLMMDLTQLRNQATKAFAWDLYVSRDIPESPAFDLEPAEMDDISNRLQEIVGEWAFDKYAVELDLEINLGNLLWGDA